MKRLLCLVALCVITTPWAMPQSPTTGVDAKRSQVQSQTAKSPAHPAQSRRAKKRNIIIFVADGLRHGSVNAQVSPTLWAIRTKGVHFRHSYSLYPTFTTANASAIATGHMLGDTGDFSNALWLGYALFDTGNFGKSAGTPVAFIENDQILSDLDAHFSGNYLGERTLLSLARDHGYNTAAVGKYGPTAIQDVAAIAPVHGNLPTTLEAIIVDDSTGRGGLPLPAALVERLSASRIPPEAPERTNGYPSKSLYSNSNSGGLHKQGTLMPNIVQQQWFTNVITRGLLPMFEADKSRPFVLLFWSRDPDGSQHNEGDSTDSLSPGINGPTSIAAVQNADRSLGQIVAWLDAHPAVKANTDILVTSDHGFATLARQEVDRSRHSSAAPSAQHEYYDENGRVDSEKGTLPPGCLAIDIAWGLKSKLWDPDSRGEANSGLPFRQLWIDPAGAWEHPRHGSGLIGPKVEKPDGSDAEVIVAGNGGSDLIYIPDGNAERLRRVVDVLFTLDYVDSIFVDAEKYGSVPGTLSLKDINLVGATRMPRPAIVVAFDHFYLHDGDLQSAVQVSDTTLWEGQGMHGGFGRESTYNNMAAIGPDFKAGYTDDAPVSNADIVPTLARIMGIELKPNGQLRGRVASEALRGQPDAPKIKLQRLASPPAHGESTVLQYEEDGGVRYLYSSQRESEKAEAPRE